MTTIFMQRPRGGCDNCGDPVRTWKDLPTAGRARSASVRSHEASENRRGTVKSHDLAKKRSQVNRLSLVPRRFLESCTGRGRPGHLEGQFVTLRCAGDSCPGDRALLTGGGGGSRALGSRWHWSSGSV